MFLIMLSHNKYRKIYGVLLENLFNFKGNFDCNLNKNMNKLFIVVRDFYYYI